MIGFEPLEDRILVEPLKTPEISKGVHIPESARYLTAEGIVLAIGPGKTNPVGDALPMRCKVGDRVKYTPYTGSGFKLDDKDVLVLSERDILGILKDPSA